MRTERRARFARGTGFCAALACAGCTTLLGIDGEFEQADAGLTLGGVGGTLPSTGGVVGNGGVLPGGGGSGTGGAAGMMTIVDSGPGGTVSNGGSEPEGGTPPCGGECPAGEKCCPGRDPDTLEELYACTEPSIFVGCSLDGCGNCPNPPLNGYPVCRNERCTFACEAGYVVDGDRCVPIGTGGSGGGGNAGSGGTGGSRTCDPMECSGCSLFGPFPCCTTLTSRCGCTYTPGAYCLPS